MALKIMKRCEDCSRRCKQQVDETVWEGAVLITCPRSSKGYKKKGKSDK